MNPPATAASVSRSLAPGLDEQASRDLLARRFHLVSAALSLAVTLISLTVLAGWWFDIPALTSVFPGFVTMKVNSAVALVLTGAALWLYRGRTFSHHRDMALKSLAGAAAVIAFVTTIEHLTGWNLHVDQLLMHDGTASGLPAGRMELATATCLMLVNAAMLIADTPGRYLISQLLVGGAILLATLNAVGYFFGLDAFTGIASYGAMAVHTSVSILLLSFGFLFARPDEGLMNSVTDAGAGGLTIRQLLPVVFVLPVLLAWLSWQGVRLGLYEPSFAMALFVALATNALSYAVWGGGHLLRGFDDKRLAAEAERLESEERLRRAVTDAPVPMIIHDSSGHILHMSQGWSQYSGYTLDEVPAVSTWIATAKPAGPWAIHDYLDQIARATDTVHGGEWAIQTRGGDTRSWELSTTPLGGLGSRRQTFVTTAVDITDRKQAEGDLRRMNEGLEQRIGARTTELTRANDALKRQSDQLKEQATLLDLVRDGILVRDLYGTIVYWNAGATDMYGWRSNEALGAVSHQLIRAEYGRPIADIETQVMQAGYWEGEGVHTTRGGTRLAVESRWTLTRNERGVPQGFLEVNRDISARKQAQESLKDSEVRFRAVAETAIEGIISMDDRGTISYWNPGAERLFGRPATEAVGQAASIALPERVLSNYEQKNGERVVGSTFETAGLRRDGSTFPVELSLSAWANTQGARFFTGIARDITERKSAERALEAKAEELARSNQELEQFAYVASHDLQEPLRMVSNYTQLLARRYKDQLDADANEFIGFAVDGAKRMQDLIRDLLEYARVGTRGKEFKAVPVERIAADALANLSGAIDEARAEITVDPLPTLACDATQVGQVLQNLIGNAIKFRRAGERPAIRVSAAHRDDAWTFSVRDNGIGIEAKYFDRIFQMFQRLHGRGEYAGTGIGLALCKKIVERHGGRIRVESTPGQGTTFAFTIPDDLDRAA